MCVYVCIYVCVCTEVRGCRRRCADETAAQRCGSGAPTLVHFSLCPRNAEEVRHILEANISKYHQSSLSPATRRLVGHSCGTLLWVTLVGSSCGALFWDTLDTTMIPLTSDTPRLRQHVSRSPVARRHANALPTKAAQIPMALRHHERTLATRSVHTLEAHIPHDTPNHPAHQRHAAFTPASFALPSGTAPRKRSFHQGRANPNGTVTSRTYFGHTVCPHTRSKHIT